MIKMYTKETLHELDDDIKYYKEQSKNLQDNSWHKDVYSDRYARQIKRLKKLRKFLERGLKVEFFGQKNFGLVEINNTFVVSLLHNEWRTVRRNKWYKHKQDLDHFIDKYIIGEKDEANT
jgi:hypothetical protein